MPKRIPRTEYSADSHWELIRSVTGIDVDETAAESTKQQARNAFRSPAGWNYDVVWGTLINNSFLGEYYTDMGHAEYVSDGSDFRDAAESWCRGPEDVLAFNPEHALPSYAQSDLVARFEKNYHDRVSDCPDAVNMTGVYDTLISGLLDLFGWDHLLTAIGIDADGFGRVAASYARWAQQFFDALAESTVPVVMMHDDIVWTSGPFVAPEWYREYVFPHYHNYLAPLREAGKKILYTSDGNYTMFIDDVAASGVHGFVLEPTTDLERVAERYGQTHVIIGNADTRILLSGTHEEIRSEVERCMSIGRNCPGFFMAVGNHIPANTPVENALYYNEQYRRLSTR